MSQTKTKNIKKYLPLIALPLILVVVLGLWANFSRRDVVRVHSDNGVWDLRDFDLANARVAFEGYAGFINNALLTPGEFAERENEQEFRDPRFEDFITSRLIILVPDDGWYSFSRISAFPSHRVYANGEFLHEIGSPGATRDENIPNTGRITFSVRPVDGVIEIVQQSANFVHREGSMHHTWEMSKGMAVFEEALATDFLDSILMGMHLMIFLVFTIIFITLRGSTNNLDAWPGRKRSFRPGRGSLYCALFCLTWFLRMGLVNGGVIKTLVPGLSWFVTFRIEYIAMPVATVLVIVIVRALFPGVLHKNYLRFIFAGSITFILICVFADILFMSQTLMYFYVYLGITILLLFTQLIMKVRKTSAEQFLIIVGILVFVVSSVFDVFYFSFPYSMLAPPFSFSGIALLIYALCQSTAVFLATMREMEAAKEDKRRLSLEVQASGRVNQLRTEMMRTISHEIRTPLSVMMGYAQLSAEEARTLGLGERMIVSLDAIAEEAKYMANVVEEIRQFALIPEYAKDRRPIDVSAVINKVSGLFEKVLAQNVRGLTLDMQEDLPKVFGTESELTSVMFNLLRNAEIHGKYGDVAVTAKQAGTNIEVTVADNGQGIPAELLPKVTERGVSGGEDGSGFGLAICKDIFDVYGGEMSIESEYGKGTTVKFSLPVCEDGEELGVKG